MGIHWLATTAFVFALGFSVNALSIFDAPDPGSHAPYARHRVVDAIRAGGTAFTGGRVSGV